MANETNATENTQPKATKEEMKQLFAAWQDLQDDLASAEAAVKEQQAKVSAAVKKIGEAGGLKSYNYNGQVVRPVCRKNAETGEESWFMRGLSKQEIEVL